MNFIRSFSIKHRGVQKTKGRLLRLILSLIVTLMLFSISGKMALALQDDDYDIKAQELLEEMTIGERVGQLFLVTFAGNTAPIESDISDLIRDYHIGGVVLQDENNNFGGTENPTRQLAELITTLQSIALHLPETRPPFEETQEDQLFPALTPIAVDITGTATIPLIIATVHEGDGAPFTEIRDGLTELPNPMALGATWNPELSRATGEIAGRELAALGINMIFGPSLDVLEAPRPENQGDLGTRSFGGDPYWVGLMGQAYTRGVHVGSNDRIAVIAKHFPGYGSSDRPINEEVGTVRKSLEQLKQIELAPFFAVTGNAPDAQSTVDGIMTSFVRYQGFQGNIRDTTAPVSFDPVALNTLMEITQFAEWRQSRGVIVSDELGVGAVQRFYDDSGREFPHRQVAKDALLAGNDLLYLSKFALPEQGYRGQLANIKDTINWFIEKYETDQSFQQRIDDAAFNILRLKLQLYSGDFSRENVLIDAVELFDLLNKGEGVVFGLAQQAITLISPGTSEVLEQFPPPVDDDIVIFTDVRQSRQCSTCSLTPWLDRQAIERRMLALYGPQASNQVRPEQLSSFSFAQLKEFLETETQSLSTPVATVTATTGATSPEQESEGQDQVTAVPTGTTAAVQQVQSALENADWIIFAMLRPADDIEASDALNLFLARRPDIVRNSKLIVFAYNAPYYLDTTEISKLTAYFGVYSKIDAFIDASVRALFNESPLLGRPPVSIDGIGYDLFEVTKPAEDQVLELFIVDDGTLKSPPGEEPLEVVPGATLRLQTGVIVDKNGKPVPDGTPVNFVQQDRIQGFVNIIAERPTVGGVANLDYLLEARSGNFRITIAAGDAVASQEVDIVIGESAVVSVNTPTPAPTETSTITPTPTQTSTPTITPSPTWTLTPEPTVTPAPPEQPKSPTVEILFSELEMLLTLGLGLLVTSSAGFVIGRRRGRNLSAMLRAILWSILGGLLAYDYFALGLPGTGWLESLGSWAGLVTTMVGGFAGLFINWLLVRYQMAPT